MMFPEDRLNAIGFFVATVFISGFSVGTCQYVARWIYQGVAYVDQGYFEVLPGGDSRGAVISMFYFDTPQGRFLVHQTDAGITTMGKNPQ
jgi:hypothetical protein